MPGGATVVPLMGLPCGPAEFVEVVLGHDGCELGVHLEFPSIGFNVISGWTETRPRTSAERRRFVPSGPYSASADPLVAQRPYRSVF